MRKLKYLSLILILSVLMFAQYEIPIENLLTNSGLGVWSQSDTNKGIAALIYDTGSAGGGNIPDVGDAVTGGASGATGKIMSMTINNTFVGGNAWGTIQLGSTTGCFNDDEALVFTDGETAVANHPDGAVGADKLVKNGAFVHNIDPPNDWIDGDVADLDTEAGGQIGNCLEINENGNANPYAYQSVTLATGKIYKFSFYIKQGTETTYRAYLWKGTNTYGFSTNQTATAAWVQKIVIFECLESGAHTITLMQRCGAAAATNILFDEVTLYEITPGCTGADAKALDTWVKDTTIDIYREHNGANTKDGSFYALKMVVMAASDYVRWPGAFYNLEEWYMQFQGRTVTIGAWVKTSTANHAKLTLTDSAGSTSSSFHTGGGTFEWLETTRTIDGGATSFAVYVYGDIAGTINGNTIIYVSQGILSFQSSIGSGNYSPRQHEVIWLEKMINSNLLYGTTAHSDIGWLVLNIEGDSNAMLPKGCKALQINIVAKDSGSANNDASWIGVRKDTPKAWGFICRCGGLTNDLLAEVLGWQDCDSNGDIQYRIDASGAGTLDVAAFQYLAVQVTD